MASCKVLTIFGCVLVTMTVVIQSAPIGGDKEVAPLALAEAKQTVNQLLLNSINSDKASSVPTTSSTTTASPSSVATPEKKKRFINEDQLDGFFDSESDEGDDLVDKTDHVLHTKIQETSATIHDNADKPVDTDDSKVFSDIQMTPHELTDVIRRRRNVKLNDQSNRRRKRALLPYDLYDTDSFYDPYADFLEREQYDRPIRSFAPIYWYPSAYERNVRSALAPSFHESPEWPRLYSSTIDDDEYDIPDSIYNDNDDDEEEEDYESNRYPILVQSSNDPFDNFELQQQYNTDDIPIDEDFGVDNDDDADDTDDEEQYRSYYPQERSRYSWIF